MRHLFLACRPCYLLHVPEARRGEVFVGAGHVLLYDRPREVAERMRAFLR